MANINEIGSSATQAYGVKFLVCENSEVMADRAGLGQDPSGNGWREETAAAFLAARDVISRHGYDYGGVRQFAAYNGGPRKQLVEGLTYAADIFEDETRDCWKPAALPAELAAKVERVLAEAEDALYSALKAAVADEETEPG